jgi:hypothetical protein
LPSPPHRLHIEAIPLRTILPIIRKGQGEVSWIKLGMAGHMSYVIIPENVSCRTRVRRKAFTRNKFALGSEVFE